MMTSMIAQKETTKTEKDQKSVSFLLPPNFFTHTCVRAHILKHTPIMVSLFPLRITSFPHVFKRSTRTHIHSFVPRVLRGGVCTTVKCKKKMMKQMDEDSTTRHFLAAIIIITI